MYTEIILSFMISAILTLLFSWIIKKSSSSLYTSVRGGTPRAVGIAPFIAILLFLPLNYSYLVALIGIFAFLDDLIGRKKTKMLPFEIGQLSRGMGMLAVAVIGFFYVGPASILIALMIQPLNIADMQPGAACSTVIIMCILALILAVPAGLSIYIPLVVLAACIGYAPLDYKGKIMMGEIGNHSFAVALGIAYAVLGGVYGSVSSMGYSIGSFLGVLALFIITLFVISFIRRKNLNIFLEEKLDIKNPYFGDYIMDVLTGGGLGDLIRKIILGKREIIIKKHLFKILGFRRLFYNPHAYK
ncbi:MULTISPECIES: cell wall biosynthesis protein [Methanobacterium]|uniref:Cell wall biosynthesis protein n=1 Tax=Methanobacterium bryantii TaxID=2161 RepID=A0A2A2H7P1_METBR|nr:MULTISPECIES: cell wall biosynthesis protein [Methanobacterium]OEC87346.1 cell wall biosynthesis protein [Methanobacterium sp. A39]PAV05314.1 cell wall biosynthesis protein [Methanobacterium bryantii]